ncbi:hypothetical protein SAMN04489860_0977 [Paraoerskovia marina]|uniref:Glucoamylase (Glucan-1,4-alpha-glucosidase), GH15 family n=1 Tax=Paraoerskovia marina TaxID=545619 RepID=A0A1H1Q3H1_9CELL|nr:glycoside hydrolase family 15 [Paraoerskovia marina]SDS17914.1 hypothetical protein SAMN04489860_0977 [Paraoerskovia marina]
MRPRSARGRATVAAIVVVLLGLAATGTYALTRETIAHVDLYEDGVALGPDGTVYRLPAGFDATYLEGSRVLDPATLDDDDLDPDGDVTTAIKPVGGGSPASALADAAGAEQTAEKSRAWLAAGTIPGASADLEDLGTDALLDLHALVLDNGASVAAPSPPWWYTWPRDGAFVAVALARTGHVDDAADVLAFLQGVQEDDGSFQARYLPDGSGPPDDRGEQSDGPGWMLWATDEVLAAAPVDDRAALRSRLDPLVDASSTYLLSLVDVPSSLPPASSDYWEVEADELTLGTAGPVLAGLEAAAAIYADDGDGERSRSLRTAADETRNSIEQTFGAAGYPREITGGARDAATAFVLPPFQPTPLEGATEAWVASVDEMRRPAGGLAPGGGWKNDGISWTPQTSLYALTAATMDDRHVALSWLDWIDSHRTDSGAIPEKVLADGSPAAVAPLAWSAANVLIALDTLDRSAPAPPEVSDTDAPVDETEVSP